ncbi:MAG TPA: hypothetical protein VH328_04565, partial [Burkholderiaceae bacterium]|nr:hypothetical protein [Burkholderiaceae bacterium]
MTVASGESVVAGVQDEQGEHGEQRRHGEHVDSSVSDGPAPPVVRRAADLAAAFEHVPRPWRLALPGWTKEREQAVVDAVVRASGEREIGPPDPFRALRLLAPDRVRVVVFGQD